jgi:hypothetical protein
MGSIYTYRNIDGLTKFLQVMLGVGLVLAVVGLVSSFLQLELSVSSASFCVSPRPWSSASGSSAPTRMCGHWAPWACA